MRVLILGIGDAFTRRHFGSSAVIETARGSRILVDCPDLIHRALHESSHRASWSGPLDVSSIDDVIITHLHGDHCNGLESFGFYRRILRLRDGHFPRPRLHASHAVLQRLWPRLAPAMDQPLGEARATTLDDYFDVRTITPGQVADVAGAAVQCRPTQHSVPTVGLLISDDRRTLGWSADTPFERAHVDWLTAADVIVHESNLGPSHTPIDQLNALPPAIKAKIRLIHLPDDFDSSTTDIVILKEGDVIDLHG